MATEQDYTEALKKLAPRGAAWPTEDSSLWAKLLSGFSAEFARIDARARQLFEEVLPSSTTELLQDWERVVGLPDGCSERRVTLPERRAAVVERLADRGGQSKTYFIALALSLGYAITITEFDAFRVGEHSVEDILLDEDWEFVWQVNIQSNTPALHVECVIKKRKPAHTVVFFHYH